MLFMFLSVFTDRTLYTLSAHSTSIQTQLDHPYLVSTCRATHGDGARSGNTSTCPQPALDDVGALARRLRRRLHPYHRGCRPRGTGHCCLAAIRCAAAGRRAGGVADVKAGEPEQAVSTGNIVHHGQALSSREQVIS